MTTAIVQDLQGDRDPQHWLQILYGVAGFVRDATSKALDATDAGQLKEASDSFHEGYSAMLDDIARELDILD